MKTSEILRLSTTAADRTPAENLTYLRDITTQLVTVTDRAATDAIAFKAYIFADCALDAVPADTDAEIVSEITSIRDRMFTLHYDYHCNWSV